MKKIIGICMISAVFWVGSCSVDDTKEEVEVQAEQENAELAAIDASLPTMALLRVKLDAEGNEMADQIEMKVSMADNASDDLASEFAAASKASSLGEELDGDSSAQSWYMTQTTEDDSQFGSVDDSQDDYAKSGYNNSGYTNQTNQGYTNQTNQGYNQNCNPSTQVNCGTEVEHQQGTSNSIYPVKRKVIYQHNRTDIYPQTKVDIYPINNVRVHPTNTSVNVHPVQNRYDYVNPCVRNGSCGGGNYSNQFPTVNYQGYQQYYGYVNQYDQGGYRYYRYCRPGLFGRIFNGIFR